MPRKTRETFTKKYYRRMMLVKDKVSGKPTLVKRDTILPPAPRTAHTLTCGVYTFEILVSEGQIINERKMCKKLLAEHRIK